MKTLHLFSNSDQNYFDGLAITLLSALKAASGAFDYHFHILDGGIDSDSRTKLKSMIASVAESKGIDTQLTFHQIDFTTLSHLPKWRGSYMTYTKMLIPDLIPAEDTAIYVDSDTLLNRGVEEVFNTSKPANTLISGVRDYHHSLGREHPGGAILKNDEAQSPYINAGVMWLNLTGLREINILEATANVIQSHPQILKGDQTLFNYICRTRIHLLPEANNFCLSLGTGMHVVKTWQNTNLHYIGKNKPWFCKPSTTQFFAQKLWHAKAFEFGLYQEFNPAFPDSPVDITKAKKKRWTNFFNTKRARQYRQDISSVSEAIT